MFLKENISVCWLFPHLHGSSFQRLHFIHVNSFHHSLLSVTSKPAQLILTQQRLFNPAGYVEMIVNWSFKKTINAVFAGLPNSFCARCLTKAAKTGRWMLWTLSTRRTWWMMPGDSFSWRRPQATLATPSVNLEQVENLWLLLALFKSAYDLFLD